MGYSTDTSTMVGGATPRKFETMLADSKNGWWALDSLVAPETAAAAASKRKKKS